MIAICVALAIGSAIVFVLCLVSWLVFTFPIEQHFTK
jgi:hypothetical protein